MLPKKTKRRTEPEQKSWDRFIVNSNGMCVLYLSLLVALFISSFQFQHFVITIMIMILTSSGVIVIVAKEKMKGREKGSRVTYFSVS